MKNKGYITVFITILTGIIFILVLAVITMVDKGNAKAKAAIAVRSATSDIKANYDRYIFDNYHILLIDSDFDGRHEGYMEEMIENNLRTNLGNNYKDINVVVSGKKYITDNACLEFKKQIKENFKYGVSDEILQAIKDKTMGNDSPLTENDMEQLKKKASDESKEIEENNIKEKGKDDEDPRKELKKYSDSGIAALIRPEDMILHEYSVDYEDLPSASVNSSIWEFGVDRNFDSMDQLKKDSVSANGWLDDMSTNIEAIAYASQFFHCMTDENDDTKALNAELEYLICGGETDAENYQKVVNKIIAIRFAFDYAYILGDVQKVEEMSALAWSICWAAPLAQPVVKYLLLGAWAYIESVADVYSLVHGNKIAYLKTRDNWMTDIYSLHKLNEVAAGNSCENGMSYKDYLLILLSFEMDEAYYRMLDIMQMNVNLNEGNDGYKLLIRNCITAFSVDVSMNYKGDTFNFKEDTGF